MLVCPSMLFFGYEEVTLFTDTVAAHFHSHCSNIRYQNRHSQMHTTISIIRRTMWEELKAESLRQAVFTLNGKI